MSRILDQIHKADKCLLRLECLPKTTPKELQDHLWAKIGLWIPLDQICIRAADGQNFTAVVVIDKVNFAEALGRWLKSVGEKIVVKPWEKISKDKHDEATKSY